MSGHTPNRKEIDEQLSAAYNLIYVDRFGRSREAMAPIVLKLVPLYIEWVIEHNRGSFSQPNIPIGRLYYIRAACFKVMGKDKDASTLYGKAVQLYGSCDEKELCDDLGIK